MAKKYRKIDPRIWSDEKFRRLSPGDKLTAVYLLTMANRIGLYHLSPWAMADHVGIPTDDAMAALDRVCGTMGWEFDRAASVLYLPNWWKYNHPDNSKAMLQNLRDLHDLPDTELVEKFFANTRYLIGAVHKTFCQSTTENHGFPPWSSVVIRGFGVASRIIPKSLRGQVKARDGGLCRCCRMAVDFKDRKGPYGGTYHIVNTSNEITCDNVVILCRECQRKATKGENLALHDAKNDAFETTVLDRPRIDHGNRPRKYQEQEQEIREDKSVVVDSATEFEKPATEPFDPVQTERAIEQREADTATRFVREWNQHVPFAQVSDTHIPPLRARRIRTRMSESSWLETYKKALTMIAASPFLRGEVKDWRIDIDWFLSDDHAARILEGRYSTRIAQDARSQPEVTQRSKEDFLADCELMRLKNRVSMGLAKKEELYKHPRFIAEQAKLAQASLSSQTFQPTQTDNQKVA